MQPTQFDKLIRTLTSDILRHTTRRGLMAAMAGTLLGQRLIPAPEVEAGRKKKKKKKDKGRGGNGCKPSCGGAQCGSDGCGGSCGKCGGGLSCLRGTCQVIPPGSTFTVSGREIHDPVGNAVLLRGVNKMSVFDDDDPTGSVSFPEIAKTGANTVRIVWAITTNLSRNGPQTDLDFLNVLITNAKDAGLVPMIELHDATGDWSRLDELVAYWTRPAVVDLIADHSQYLLVNIGNEVGDDQVGNSEFRSAYRDAVQALRDAGIHTPLVIDAPDWGKNLDVLSATAATLLDDDPDHNLIFSVHLYWGIADGADADFLTDALEGAAAEGYPLIVGEFSKFGAYNGDNSICAAGGRIDYQTILEQTQRLGIGWYAWEWGPGNSYGDPLCDVMDMTTDRLFTHLQAGWATEVATTSPYSIANTAEPIL